MLWDPRRALSYINTLFVYFTLVMCFLGLLLVIPYILIQAFLIGYNNLT